MKTELEEKEFVEEIGLLIEKFGIAPLQSRVISLLLARMPDGITFEEIVNFLGASKSSISTALKFFLQLKHIVYYTKPGDRKRYFKLTFSEFWLSDIERKIKEVDSIILIIEKLKMFNEGFNNKLVKNLDDSKDLFHRIQTMALREIDIFRAEINKTQVNQSII